MKKNTQLWLTWALTSTFVTVFGVGTTTALMLYGAHKSTHKDLDTMTFPAPEHLIALVLLIGGVVGSRLLWRRRRRLAGCYAAWLPFLAITIISIQFAMVGFHAPIPDFWAAAVLWLLPPVALWLHPPPRVPYDMR